LWLRIFPALMVYCIIVRIRLSGLLICQRSIFAPIVSADVILLGKIFNIWVEY